MTMMTASAPAMAGDLFGPELSGQVFNGALFIILGRA